MQFMVISQEQVRSHLPMKVCIDLMGKSFRITSAGETIQPLRVIHPLPEKRGFGLMPGYIQEPPVLGAKVTAVYPENFNKGLQSHQGGILLFDGKEGVPLALVHGGEVTAIRTAAASAAATDQLARKDASVLAVLGYGEQARNHILAMCVVRPVSQIRVWGRNADTCASFCRDIKDLTGVSAEPTPDVKSAVSGADIVCTTTAASMPILKGDWLEAGMHLNVVGSSAANARELDEEAVLKSKFYVDYRASALEQAGELLAAKKAGLVGDDHIAGELGEVLQGAVAGRVHDREITLYKSLGHAAQDLVSAEYLYQTLHDKPEAQWVSF